jgi:hypothetical protein
MRDTLPARANVGVRTGRPNTVTEQQFLRSSPLGTETG